MSYLFKYSKFKGNISNWDVSNVTNMSDMFYNSKFNGNISNWNVTNVTTMISMFSYSEFNNDIFNWDINSVTNIKYFRVLYNIEINNISDFNKYKDIMNEINIREQKLGLYKHLFSLR